MAIVPSLLATTYLKTARSVRVALLCVVIAGAFDGIYGATAELRGIRLYEGDRFSAIAGVNFDAMIILAAAAIAWALWSDVPRLVGAAMLSGAGIAPLSRAGLVGFAAAFGTAILPVLRRKGKVIALVMVLAVALAAFGAPVVQERIQSRLHEKTLDIAGGKTSIEIRFLVVRAALRAFYDRPVTGVGYNGFLEYSSLDPDIALVSFGEGVYTHDTPLEVLAEGGILATVPFLAFFGSVVGVGLILWRRARWSRDRLSAAALASLVVVLISGIFANVLLHYFVWAMIGIAIACSRLPAVEEPPAGENSAA